MRVFTVDTDAAPYVKVSSLPASRGCPVSDDGNGVALYDGINFTGANALVKSNVPDLGAVGLNDRVSPLTISRGLVVSLYSDVNYQGVSKASRPTLPVCARSVFPTTRLRRCGRVPAPRAR